MTIKAIETFYNGYRFRSRLEARWAVFFDVLGIPYEYEKEGYDLDGTWYLPDCWMPSLNSWVEIKGEEPNEQDARKAELLARNSEKKVYVFWGVMPYPTPTEADNDSAYLYNPDGSWDNNHWWCECSSCGAIEIQYMARSDRMACKSSSSYPCPKSDHGDKGYTDRAPKLVRAYQAARSYRFERKKAV